MSEAVHDAQRLKELQALPLDRKIQISQARIIEWYTRNKGNVVVSFSGGKDSTVLLHLVRSLFPDVRAVFSNTGLEYPEIQRFVRSVPNVTIVAPKVSFHEVLSTCGYPLIGKEVAEAIYYARRLRSQNLNVEREREREQERRNAVEAGRALRLPENERGGVHLARQTRTPRNPDISSTPAERRTDGQSSPASGGGLSTRMLIQGQYPAGGVSGNRPQTERPQRTLAERNPVDGRLLETRNVETVGPQRETTSRGKWHDYHRRSLNNRKDNPDDLECFYNRRTEWSDWRRGCL